MNRMNLTQLVNFFSAKGFPQTAHFFQGCMNDEVTVDGLIETYFVRKHVGEGMLWREIESSVTTYINCENETIRQVHEGK